MPIDGSIKTDAYNQATSHPGFSWCRDAHHTNLMHAKIDFSSHFRALGCISNVCRFKLELESIRFLLHTNSAPLLFHVQRLQTRTIAGT
jgi:hypothetical protein